MGVMIADGTGGVKETFMEADAEIGREREEHRTPNIEGRREEEQLKGGEIEPRRHPASLHDAGASKGSQRDAERGLMGWISGLLCLKGK